MREARGPAWTDWLHEHGIVGAVRDRHALARPAPARRRARCASVAVAGDGSTDEAVRAVQRAAGDGGPRARRGRLDARAVRLRARAAAVRVAVVDYGCKRSILRRLAARGRRGHGLPARRRRRRARGATTASCSRTAPATRSRSGRGRDDPRAARQGAGARHLPRPPAARARDRPRDVQAAVRPPRREPPGARPPRRPRARDEPEPRLRGRAGRREARRRTSRSTTARSRASTSRTCAPARCSSTPRPGPGPHDAWPILEHWVEEVSVGAAA